MAHYPPGATFGPRVLADFEFVWLLRGSAQWRYADDDQVSEGDHARALRPGTLLLARPGMRDHFTWDAERPSVHAYVHFSLDTSDEDGGPLGDPEGWPLTRSLSAVEPLAALCRYLLWLGGAASPRAAARQATVVGWLLELFVTGSVAEEEQPLDEHLLRVVDHVRTVWRDGTTRAVGLGELARAAGLSRGHLARIFAQQVGLGPVSAVDLVRLARAATLLRRSNLPVAAVAQACGFVNPFHFSHRFRRTYGVSPRAYRNLPSADDPLGPLARSQLLPFARRLLVDDVQ